MKTKPYKRRGRPLSKITLKLERTWINKPYVHGLLVSKNVPLFFFFFSLETKKKQFDLQNIIWENGRTLLKTRPKKYDKFYQFFINLLLATPEPLKRGGWKDPRNFQWKIICDNLQTVPRWYDVPYFAFYKKNIWFCLALNERSWII